MKRLWQGILKNWTYWISFAVVLVFWGFWEWRYDKHLQDNQSSPTSWYDARKLPDSLSAREIHGLWGDSFGSLNALFAGLAFAGLITTILIQLRDARDREKQRHEDLERQSLDVFDERFFKLLGFLQAYAEKMSFEADSKMHGDVAIAKLGQICIFKADDFEEGLPSRFDEEFQNILKADASSLRKFEMLYKIREPELGPYFRMLEIILSNISNLDALHPEKCKEYLEILRASLPTVQLILIALCAKSSFGTGLHAVLQGKKLFHYIDDLGHSINTKALTEGLE